MCMYKNIKKYGYKMSQIIEREGNEKKIIDLIPSTNKKQHTNKLIFIDKKLFIDQVF